MKELVREFIDGKVTRRNFIQGLLAVGFSFQGSNAILNSIVNAAEPAVTKKNFTGTGGEVIIETVLAGGVEYMFAGNGTGLYPVYDALVDRDKPRFILGTEEGQVVAMAEGYHLATGKTAFVNMSRIGIPHSSNNLYNAWKDQSSVVVITDAPDSRFAGRNGFEDVDDWLEAVSQFTKWRWMTKHPERIVELVRRAMQLASIPPKGPTYLMVPTDIMTAEGIKAEIPVTSFPDFSMKIEPDKKEIEKVAKMLLESKAPLLHVGHEVTRAGAVKDLIELTELLNVPVTQGASCFKDFPTNHVLYHGTYWAGMTYDINVDLFMNIGAQMPDMSNLARGIPGPVPYGAKIVHARIDSSDIARVNPVDSGIVAEVGETIRAILDSVKSMATPERLEKIRKEREGKILVYTSKLKAKKEQQVKKKWDNPVISWERITGEIDRVIEKDAVIVPEVENPGGSTALMDFSPDGKTCIGWTMGSALGWGHGAAAGVKIALPDRQVVSLIGDGGFLMCGPSALWSMARYEIPVITVVYNNRSYDGPRSRMFGMGKRQGQEGKDIACYLGNPDVDYAGFAKSFGVQGEKVETVDQIKPALERAVAATKRGEPYLIDAVIERLGPGASSTWYPKTSIKDMRTKQV